MLKVVVQDGALRLLTARTPLFSYQINLCPYQSEGSCMERDIFLDFNISPLLLLGLLFSRGQLGGHVRQ